MAHAPIVLFDEIDSICKARGSKADSTSIHGSISPCTGISEGQGILAGDDLSFRVLRSLAQVLYDLQGETMFGNTFANTLGSIFVTVDRPRRKAYLRQPISLSRCP